MFTNTKTRAEASYTPYAWTVQSCDCIAANALQSETMLTVGEFGSFHALSATYHQCCNKEPFGGSLWQSAPKKVAATKTVKRAPPNCKAFCWLQKRSLFEIRAVYARGKYCWNYIECLFKVLLMSISSFSITSTSHTGNPWTILESLCAWCCLEQCSAEWCRISAQLCK